MDADKVNVYAACDKAIKAMNRENLEAFGRLKLAKWDDVHIIRTVAAIYRESAKRARKRYYEIAFEAYLLGMALCGEDPKTAHEMAEKVITEEWVLKVLKETDPVTLYRFDTETERKVYRLAEALEATDDRNSEIDKALRYWSRQIGQYAINVTDYAMMEAFEAEDIPKVRWMTAKDERVCHECHSYGGKVFALDEVPPKPHWGCRCWLVPVR